MSHSDFQLGEAIYEDLDELVHVLSAAWKEDDIWSVMLKDATAEEEHDLVCAMLAPRLKPESNVSMFKITQKNTGRIVAWAGLKYPSDAQPSKPDLPLPAKLNHELFRIFLSRLDAHKNYGYDATVDFSRVGTMVLPEFQKLGLGSWMTRRCNAEADAVRARIFVGARPSSLRMFERNGFRVVGDEGIRMVEFGGVEGAGGLSEAVRDAVVV